MLFLFRLHGLRSTRPFSFPLFQRSCSQRNIWLAIRQQSGRTRIPSPLRKSIGDKLDQIPQDFVFWGILGLNGAVFLMWQLAKSKMVTFYCSQSHCQLDLYNSNMSRMLDLIKSCLETLPLAGTTLATGECRVFPIE